MALSAAACSAELGSPELDLVALGQTEQALEVADIAPPALPVPMDTDETEGGPPDESQCGPSLDFQDVELYDGSYGVSVDFVNRKQLPVAQLQWKSDLAARYTNPGNVAGVRWCSATLIAPDLLLTAGHCLEQGNGWVFPREPGTSNPIDAETTAREMLIHFKYQRDADGDVYTAETVEVLDMLEHRGGGYDYAILRVAGEPGQRYGVAPIDPYPTDGDTLAIIGHPNGVPKVVSGGTLDSHDADWLYYGDLDTLGGSSGSGVLEEESGALVAVHTNGGCDSSFYDFLNRGVRISAILPHSPVLQRLHDDRWGYTWSHCLTGSCTGFDDYSRNSSGGLFGSPVSNTITQTATGRYTVTFSGVDDARGGNVLVTAYGSDSTRCKVRSWSVGSPIIFVPPLGATSEAPSPTGSDSARSSALIGPGLGDVGSLAPVLSPNVRAYIDCYSAAGVLTNSRFVVSFYEGSNQGGKRGAYVWSDGSEVPPVRYQWNSSGALNTVTRIPGVAVGGYWVTFPGQAPAPRGGTVQVTAYGTDPSHCTVQSWGASGTSVRARVRCWDNAGNPADSRFTAFYTPAWTGGGLSGGHAWVRTDASVSSSYEYTYFSGMGERPEATATASPPGVYSVTYQDLSFEGSSALATAYGNAPNHCKIASWGGGSDTTVNLRCFDPAGSLVDSAFVSGYTSMDFVLSFSF